MPEIQEQTLYIGKVPVLANFLGTPEEAAQKGTIFFYHGFNASKNNYADILELFSMAGYLALGIDAVGHGDRRYPDFDKRFPPVKPDLAGSLELEAAFLELVRATAQEVPFIIDELVKKQWAIPGRIGIAGHSFGGFITYAAVTLDKRIQVAAPVAGSPEWKIAYPDSPHFHPDKFFPVALQSITAGQDDVVSPTYARELHSKLTSYYAVTPERLHYIEYPEATHSLSAELWEEVWVKTLGWFEQYI